MNPTERVVLLREMLPGLSDLLYEALAADRPHSSNDDLSWVEQREKLVDVMARLRFNDAKSRRVQNCCGESGAKLWGCAYYTFTNQLKKAQDGDLAVAMGVAQAVPLEPDTPQAEAAAEVVNDINEQRGGRYEHLKFDVTRLLRALAVERYLKASGQVHAGVSNDRAVVIVRNVLRRWERRPDRTLEEVMGVAQPRSQHPNMLFSDGKFGDGTELVTQMVNGVQVQVRTSKVEPIVPGVVGLNRMELMEAIQEKLQARAEK